MYLQCIHNAEVVVEGWEGKTQLGTSSHIYMLLLNIVSTHTHTRTNTQKHKQAVSFATNRMLILLGDYIWTSSTHKNTDNYCFPTHQF